jgi:hypothetical protein
VRTDCADGSTILGENRVSEFRGEVALVLSLLFSKRSSASSRFIWVMLSSWLATSAASLAEFSSTTTGHGPSSTSAAASSFDDLLLGAMEYPEPRDDALPPGHLEVCTSASGMTTSQSESESESESSRSGETRAASWGAAKLRVCLSARCGVVEWRHGDLELWRRGSSSSESLI